MSLPSVLCAWLSMMLGWLGRQGWLLGPVCAPLGLLILAGGPLFAQTGEAKLSLSDITFTSQTATASDGSPLAVKRPDVFVSEVSLPLLDPRIDYLNNYGSLRYILPPFNGTESQYRRASLIYQSPRWIAFQEDYGDYGCDYGHGIGTWDVHYALTPDGKYSAIGKFVTCGHTENRYFIEGGLPVLHLLFFPSSIYTEEFRWDLNTGLFTHKEVQALYDFFDGQVRYREFTYISEGIARPSLAPVPLTMVTSSLAPAYFKESNYNSGLAAIGGTPPYTWTASDLPHGLSITTDPSGLGQISGTVVDDAEDSTNFDRLKRRFQVQITVGDGFLQTDTGTFWLDWSCGTDGSEDGLIGQYIDYSGGLGVGAAGNKWAPRCKDTTRSAGNAPYIFAVLNTSNTMAPEVALVANSLINGGDINLPAPFGGGLFAMIFKFYMQDPISGGAIPAHFLPCIDAGKLCLLNSGFRSPLDQERVYIGKTTEPPRGGRHMFGDAVDIPAPHKTRAEWDALAAAALFAGASFIENVYSKQYSCNPIEHVCMHADWRGWTKTYAK